MWPKSDKDHTGQEGASGSLDACKPLRKGATIVKSAEVYTGAFKRLSVTEQTITKSTGLRSHGLGSNPNFGQFYRKLLIASVSLSIKEG